MNKFITEKGRVLPLDRANVDTDFIIPKQFLKSIKRTGFGVNLFDEHRYLDKGEPDADNSQRPLNTDFVLNQPRYQGASILLAQENFGCGSSREHAPWALEDYGFRAILAPSFADIFFNNCFKNGLLPIVLDKELISGLFEEVASNEGYELEVDLNQQRIIKPDGSYIEFSVDAFRKHCLLNGLDDIGLTLEDADEIKAFEADWRERAPWYFSAGESV
ncbi:MAG: 3-isopropylmalate dehydratase small subunit [Gammaproteobacteria bacterium]|jgi:3-isopropylmalate/(R)-2-methylmalate dehydratase small subunit|nr:3-isopropylmalate dehydratase small subunit [Gammaproteobacteria bacterium]MBT3858734.1 3-isopropylmalate dehydratase small subunit [Gammaproteobacteria bacterium]MBT3986086.1 3-isopropylmalate dehydratase small subunit [Gammaproteobacteria bacterium]MBT4256580.1 3-isopropylmalate dehydratase small subunit [Gammaproteobacteria bacterium]MBT4580797.1 3-isopropylmalate dehydratase small subunit [Gammaproteobacteria bacterium]